MFIPQEPLGSRKSLPPRGDIALRFGCCWCNSWNQLGTYCPSFAPFGDVLFGSRGIHRNIYSFTWFRYSNGASNCGLLIFVFQQDFQIPVVGSFAAASAGSRGGPDAWDIPGASTGTSCISVFL